MKKIILIIFILAYKISYGQLDEVTNYKPTDDINLDKSTTIPFSILDVTPLFKDCEDLNRNEQNVCFLEQITKHVEKNWKYIEKPKQFDVLGKVIITLTINNEGYIISIIARGGDKFLREEAKRVFRLLPKIKPGIYKGRPVTTEYSYTFDYKNR